jgi:hypothetical protein
MAALRDEAVWGGPRPSQEEGDAGPAPERVWGDEDVGAEGFLRDVDRRVADLEAGLHRLLDDARRQAAWLVSDARMEAGRIIAAARSTSGYGGLDRVHPVDDAWSSDRARADPVPARPWPEDARIGAIANTGETEADPDTLDAVIDLDRMIVRLFDDGSTS